MEPQDPFLRLLAEDDLWTLDDAGGVDVGAVDGAEGAPLVLPVEKVEGGVDVEAWSGGVG